MPHASTSHTVFTGAAQSMKQLQNQSVELVVTSPPYPMIEMWDEIMASQHTGIREALAQGKGLEAYELMHQALDLVWEEVERVLIPGGFACINIGDATRTIQGDFALYPNHARIIQAFQQLKMNNLPNIIWRKQTNAPNKFMGSGMMPAGAYVTLEHEWILIFRKGGKRIFKSEQEKLQRKESAFFWEERNNWFSDVWELKGTRQAMVQSESRKRSAAYPFEIPYRLINMYSLKGDTVLDPFLGTGTTSIAAITSERNSIGYEIDPALREIITCQIEQTSILELNAYIRERLSRHQAFLAERLAAPDKEDLKYVNENLNMPVMTAQETELYLSYVEDIVTGADGIVTAEYSKVPPSAEAIDRKKKREYQISMGF